MEVQLIYKDNSFVYTVSPLMPISYLRALSQKSFNIPEFLINLSYQNNNIEKKFNETSLKEYFKKNSRIIITVTEAEPKFFIKNLQSTTIAASTLKSTKLSKLIQEEKKLVKKKIDFFKSNQEEDFFEEKLKKDKCQNCNKNPIDFFCREDCKFLCKNCKKLLHSNHRILILEKGNIEQFIYNYKKELLKEVQNQENDIKDIIEKSGVERINDKIEEVYDILAKIGKLEKEITENFPCLPIESISNNDYNEIRKKIFSIELKFNKKNPYCFQDKISFFKQLQNEDFNINDLNKDIESIKKKIDFQDMLYEVLEQIGDNFNYLHDALNEIWNGNKTNILTFSHEMDNFIKMIKKKFNLNNNNNEEEEESENLENELDELFLESKKFGSNNFNSNMILPKLLVRKRNEKVKSEDNNFPLFNTINLERRRRININDDKKSFSSSENSSSNTPKKNLKKKVTKNSLSERSKKASGKLNNFRKDDFKLDQVLLTENENEDNGPKRPPKRNSIRMSIFIKNMNKVDSLSPSKIMKVKKKKKKY